MSYCYPQTCYSYQCFDYDTCRCRTKGNCSSSEDGLNILSVIFPIMFGILLIVAIVSYFIRRRRLRRLATQGRVVFNRTNNNNNNSINLQAFPQNGYGMPQQDQSSFYPQIHEAKVDPFPNEMGQNPANHGNSVQFSEGYYPANNNMTMISNSPNQSAFGYNNPVTMGTPVYVQPTPNYYNNYGAY